MGLLTVTSYTYQSLSWEANSSWAGLEIPCNLLNLKVHSRKHKKLPLVLILSQMNSVHVLPYCIFKIYFNLYPSTPRSSNWSLSFWLPHQILYSYISLLPHTWHMSGQYRLHWFDHPSNIWWGHKKWHSVCSSVRSAVTVSVWRPNVFRSIVLSPCRKEIG